MPRSRRKRSAHSANYDVSEVVIPGGLEVHSIDVFDGKVVKKRAMEKAPVSTRIYDQTLDNDASIPSNDTLAPSNDTSASSNDTGADTPTIPNPKGPSRSASVSRLLPPELSA
jgi:hypothetical protein